MNFGAATIEKTEMKLVYLSHLVPLELFIYHGLSVSVTPDENSPQLLLLDSPASLSSADG